MHSRSPGTWLGVAAALLGPPAYARAEPAPIVTATAIATVDLTTAALDAAALREALALRLPSVRLIDATTPCVAGCALVRALRRDDGTVALTVWLADGRVFARELAAAFDPPERAVATSLAHLLAAIEDGTAAPTADPEPPPRPLARTPAPVESPPVEPVTRAIEPPTRTSAPPPPPRRFELGPAFALVSLFGVGPPRALAGSLGGGFNFDLGLRGPRGLLLGLAARVVQARDSGHRLQRVRLAFAAGYGLRRGLFELRALAAVTVEPWWVAQRADGTRRDSGPALLGGVVTLAPGLVAPLTPTLRAHVGLRLEAAASAAAGSLSAIQANGGAGAPLFRLGGFELAAMIEIGLRFQLTRAR